MVASAILGGTQVAIAASQTYGLGSHSVIIDATVPSVEVHNAAGTELWKSASDRSFISASAGLVNCSDSSGNFEIFSTNISRPCRGATISSISPSADVVTIYGDFTDNSTACRSLTWSLALSEPSQDSPGLAFVATVNGTVVSNVYLAFDTPTDEAFFGLGGQAGQGNLRGWRVPIWSREGGVGRGEEPITETLNADASLSGKFAGGSILTTYTAVAALVSSLGRWFVINNKMYGLFDLASNVTDVPFVDSAATQLAGEHPAGDRSTSSTKTVEIMFEGSTMSGSFGVASKGNAYLEAINGLSKVTSRQPDLPEWAHDGAILGIQGGQTKVEGIINAAFNYSMPVVSVWLQDWCGTRLQPGAYNISISRLWWNWEPDQSLYPTWAEWVPHLQDAYGVRTMSYINTFLANVSTKSTGYEQNFYAEAFAEGRFVLNASASANTPWTVTSGPGIDAGLLDLSNQTTVQWFKDLVAQQYYSVPVSGMMQDFGEYLAVDGLTEVSSGTVNPRDFHNAYPGAWAQLLRSVVEDLGQENSTIGFHRSANTFSGKHTNLFWVGDQNIDTSREDGMRSVISSTIQMGFSGWGQTHSDIGGYTNTLSPLGNITRSAALLGRWGEMGAFAGTAFRTHEGNIPSVNAQFYTNSSTYAYHAYNSRLFASLKDYRKSLLTQYRQSGWPLVRHPVVYAPTDVVSLHIIDEVFWLGEALLVAPVYDLYAQNLTVVLPKIDIDSGGASVGPSTKLKHLWTGQIFAPGTTITVPAPWGQPGVFVRWPLKAGEKELLQPLFDFAAKANSSMLTA